MNRPKSECCNSIIDVKVVEYKHGSLSCDVCSDCGKYITYASHGFGGIYRGFDDKLHSFRMASGSWPVPQYVGQIKETVNTLGIMFNTQDTDMLEDWQLNKFYNKYKNVIDVKYEEFALKAV